MFISKEMLYIVGLIAILLVGVGIGRLGREVEVPSASQAAAVVENASATAEKTTTPEPLLRKGGEEEVKVVRVVDGDTIEVEINGKVEPVRYIGIDTPETVDPRKPVQCFGVEAAKKNKELMEGEMVRLEGDTTDRDKYNRLLRYVWLGDTLINEALVAQGFAKSYSYPPDIKYQDRFVSAEKKARENKLGLWTACASATQTVSATPTAAASASAASPSCTIKGNISAAGEKIYHLQGCGSYAKTTIDENRGERWFCSESEAQSAGWRKALNCP
ncbi:MAG: thermonuclease family protein [Patescibacteria group bacterium]